MGKGAKVGARYVGQGVGPEVGVSEGTRVAVDCAIVAVGLGSCGAGVDGAQAESSNTDEKITVMENNLVFVVEAHCSATCLWWRLLRRACTERSERARNEGRRFMVEELPGQRANTTAT